MNDDFIIDLDILKPKKKKKNSTQKGKRVERTLVKLFTERFGDGFSRTIGSGNRWGQVAYLPKHAQDTFTGDLVTPAGFQFVIESKGGYDDIDLSSVFVSGNAQLDEFIEQVTAESERCGRKPIILWKKSRKPWLAFVRTDDLPHLDWTYRLVYRDWSAVALEELFKLPDEFFT